MFRLPTEGQTLPMSRSFLRVLGNPALSLAIANACEGDNTTLYNMSLSCGLLRGPATSVLWRRVEAAALLCPFPDDMFEFVNGDVNIAASLRRLPLQQDWEHFLSLAKNIHHIAIFETYTDYPDESVYPLDICNILFTKYCPEALHLIFPNLRHLSFGEDAIYRPISLIPTLLRMVAHQLETCHYGILNCNAGDIRTQRAAIQSLRYAVSSLRSLRVGSVFTYEGDDGVWRDWSYLISQITDPVEIDVVFPLHPNTLSHISSRPHLTRFGFIIDAELHRNHSHGDPSLCPAMPLTRCFPALNFLQICIDNIYPFCTIHLFGIISSPLEKLQFEWTNDPLLENLAVLLDGIATYFPTLKDLCLVVRDFNGKDEDDMPEFPLQGHRFAQLSRLHHIECFAIQMELDIDAGIIQMIAQAWPRLVVLDLHHVYNIYNYDFRTSVEPIDLLPLLQGCPNLEELTIMLHRTRRSTRYNLDDLPVSGLKKLVVHEDSRGLQDRDYIILQTMFPVARRKFVTEQQDE